MTHDKTQPPVRIPESIDIPVPQVTTLANGVKLYTLDCTEQDVIRFSFVFRAGTAVQHAPFTASSTANLLSEGSTLHSAQEIAETLDYHGSYFDVSLDRDYAVLNFVSLLKHFPQTLDIAREIVLAPAFPENEIAMYREKRKQRLAQSNGANRLPRRANSSRLRFSAPIIHTVFPMTRCCTINLPARI